MHQDIVATYPPEVEPLGRSDTCAVQGMYIPKCLITVQGHPEFTKDIVSEILVSRHEAGIFDDGMFEDAMKRVGNRQDGVDIAAAFLKFLLE
jgi:GMP synthase-like glutamine amidotransferase